MGHVARRLQWGQSSFPVPPWRAVPWPRKLRDRRGLDSGARLPEFRPWFCHWWTPLCHMVPVGEMALEVVLSSAWYM